MWRNKITRKTIVLWLAPAMIFVGLFLSSTLRPPYRSSPQAAFQHLLSAMKRKDVAAINEVCTSEGGQSLIAANDANFTSSALHDYLKSKGFHYDSRKHNSWDIWREWATHVNLTNSKWSKNLYLGDAVDFVSQDQAVTFTFVKTSWSGWKLDSINSLVVR